MQSGHPKHFTNLIHLFRWWYFFPRTPMVLRI